MQEDQAARGVRLVEVLARPAVGVGLDADGPGVGREPGRRVERGQRPAPAAAARPTARRPRAGTPPEGRSGRARAGTLDRSAGTAGTGAPGTDRSPRPWLAASRAAPGGRRGRMAGSWSPSPPPSCRPFRPGAPRPARRAVPRRGPRRASRARAGVVHAPGGALAARVPGAARRHRHARRLPDARAGVRDHAAAGAPARRGRGDPVQRHRRAAARRRDRRRHRARAPGRSWPHRCAPRRTSSGCRPWTSSRSPRSPTPSACCVRELGSTPLIGFAGAPFTLASYLVEGGPSRNHERTKALMHAAPDVWHALMARLADITATFLRAQVDAGVDAVQLFDSWAGALSLRDYREYVLPHSARVLAGVAGAGVPRIHFGVGTGELLGAMGEAGADVVGVDWRVPLDAAARRTGGTRALQGNLDPAVLFADAATVEAEARRIVAEGRAAPGHVFNLGHGVLPGTTDPDVLHAAGRAGARHSSSANAADERQRGRESPRVAVVGGGISGSGRRAPPADAARARRGDRRAGAARPSRWCAADRRPRRRALRRRRRGVPVAAARGPRPARRAGAGRRGGASGRRGAVGPGRGRHRAASSGDAAGGADERGAARRGAVAGRRRGGGRGTRPGPATGPGAATWRSARYCATGSATSWPTGWPIRCSAGSTRAGWTRWGCARRCRRWPRRWTRARRR